MGEDLVTTIRKYDCFLSKVSRLVNEYSTGPVLLMMAVERFIVVVLPFKAKTILTPNYYLVSSFVVMFITTFMTTAGTIGFFQGWNRCPSPQGYITQHDSLGTLSRTPKSWQMLRKVKIQKSRAWFYIFSASLLSNSENEQKAVWVEFKDLKSR